MTGVGGRALGGAGLLACGVCRAAHQYTNRTHLRFLPVSPSSPESENPLCAIAWPVGVKALKRPFEKTLRAMLGSLCLKQLHCEHQSQCFGIITPAVRVPRVLPSSVSESPHSCVVVRLVSNGRGL